MVRVVQWWWLGVKVVPRRWCVTRLFTAGDDGSNGDVDEVDGSVRWWFRMAAAMAARSAVVLVGKIGGLTVSRSVARWLAIAVACSSSFFTAIGSIKWKEKEMVIEVRMVEVINVDGGLNKENEEDGLVVNLSIVLVNNLKPSIPLYHH